MKIVANILTANLLVGLSSAQLIVPFNQPSASGRSLVQQQAMNQANPPGIQLPPSSSTDNPDGPSNGDVILSDVIGNQRTINLFAGFTRDIDSIAKRLDTTNLNTTVLAPINSAISSLPRKPWEDPKEYSALGADAYKGAAGEDRAQRNLRRFTEAHVVPVSPWEERNKVKSIGGGELWWEKRDGKAVVMPGNVQVERVVSRVANGEVWILQGLVNYA